MSVTAQQFDPADGPIGSQVDAYLQSNPAYRIAAISPVINDTGAVEFVVIFATIDDEIIQRSYTFQPPPLPRGSVTTDPSGNPITDLVKFKESGGTVLDIGAITDGQFARRSGGSFEGFDLDEIVTTAREVGRGLTVIGANSTVVVSTFTRVSDQEIFTAYVFPDAQKTTSFTIANQAGSPTGKDVYYRFVKTTVLDQMSLEIENKAESVTIQWLIVAIAPTGSF